MAHILFLTPYYPPEVGAAQTRISETATRLARRGHQVTVLTTLPNYPAGVIHADYRDGKRREEDLDGVRVIRVWSYISPSKGFLARILNQLSFGFLAGRLGGRKVGHPDIIIAESPPLFDAFSARRLSRRKRSPFIFVVADLWPETAVQMGILRNRLLIWLSERLEWSTYRRAAAVCPVTPGLERILLKRGLPAEKVLTITNGVDTQQFRPMSRADARAQLGWDDRFTVMFAGTIGLVGGLETMVEAADLLKAHPNIRIMFVGDGAAKPALVQEAQRRGLTNVVFLDPQPKELLPVVVGAADVCFSMLRPLPVLKGTMPVKLYEAMGAERAILLAAEDGNASQIVVHQARAGVQVPPQDPRALAEAILELARDSERVRMLGQNGRAYVLEHFDRDKLVARLEERIETILASTRRGRRAAISTPTTAPPALEN